MSSPRLLVIADDLTGANDAGVQFAGAGIRSIVLTTGDVQSLPSSPVVVINTESRHLSPVEAARRVRKAALLGRQAGVKCYYKKTDSTLRGNIGAELEALLDATELPSIPFVPALPDLGRTTREGIHHVHGAPIAETSFSRDPLNPIRESSIAHVLAPQITAPVCRLKPGKTAPAAFRGIAVIDCECNEDLASIARAHASANRLQVFSGSVALAKYLLEYLQIESAPPEKPAPQKPILLVNGSLNERSLDQVRHGSSRFSRLQLTPEQLVGDPAQLTIPAGGGNLLLHSVSDLSELEAFRKCARSHGLGETDLHLRVAQRIGRLVQQILRADVFRTVIIFGGDTLAGIAQTVPWLSFISVGELEPGISVSIPAGIGLTLISKSGAFGDSNVVDRIVDWVEKHDDAAAQEEIRQDLA
jgi:uncharacterized protein YgbK (DUF1537 family)